ncbi:carbohydrate ABC transporter permease [uncultured Friedmanniella sp.]|uniref:carbohydrate ABC transporter permease n=1 Tax=uncultured Friedmanniella sp. TaxID=335381 RepID=UPI0035CBB695
MTTFAAPPASQRRLRQPKEPLPQYSRRKLWRLRGPLLPAFIFTLALTQLPFLVTLYISVVRWNVLEPGAHRFVGLGNYANVVTDSGFLGAIVHSVEMTVATVLIALLLGLGFALLLNQKFFGRGLARTLLISPFLVTPVAAALIWKYLLYNPTYGLFNGILVWLGQLFNFVAPQPDWVSNTPMAAIVASLAWQWVPFEMLILLAGLQSQSSDAVEAAKVDGANAWQLFRYLTLPHLRPYLELGILLGVIYITQAFDAIYTITSGGPGTATTNLPYQVYIMVFRKYDYGAAAAGGTIVVILSIFVATLALRVISSLLKEDAR